MEEQLPYLQITKASQSDHTTKDDHKILSQAGDLLIRDLGYFDVSDLQSLHECHRYFLSRVPSHVTKFFDEHGRAFDIWKTLISTHKFALEMPIKIGDQKFLTRLFAVRLPRKKWQERLALLKKEVGRTLTMREKTQVKWNLMITNMTPEQASQEIIQHLYETRWQIELLWKALKSGLGIHCLKAASCETVVKAFIWAKLLATTLLLNARGIAENKEKREIGVIKWFRCIAQKLPKVRELILREKWMALARYLRQLVLHCFRNKHSKPSTKEKLNESINLHNKRAKRSNP